LSDSTLSPLALPIMMTELAIASWETMWHRSVLMLSGECSTEEYQRMVTEKMRAVQLASQAMLDGASPEAVIRPFHKRATANATRLRK